MSIHASSLANERAKKEQGKKMRDDKEKVQEIIFALFEKHQFYNIKDLMQETRQPIAYLKVGVFGKLSQVLLRSEICYNSNKISYI